MTRAVFFDRDGVLNTSLVKDGKPYPPPTLAEFVLVPGAEQVVRRLKDAGYYLVVMTNQPDVARGTQSRDLVEAMHAKLQTSLPLDEIRVCYHDDRDNCACRKPKPGMILDAAAGAGIDLASSYVIGDRWRDTLAGKRAGCTTIFIDYHYAEVEQEAPDVRVSSLIEAAEWILARNEEQS